MSLYKSFPLPAPFSHHLPHLRLQFGIILCFLAFLSCHQHRLLSFMKAGTTHEGRDSSLFSSWDKMTMDVLNKDMIGRETLK